MKTYALPSALGLMLAASMYAAPAEAQNAISFVSTTGSGTACTRTSPCATFQAALGATASFGEIHCLDSGSFGKAAITISVTIDCAATASTTPGLTVNGAGIVARIRNLSLSGNGGVGGISNGIDFLDGSALFVENCIIANFANPIGNGIGINFSPSSGTSKLYVTDSIISNNGLPTGGGGIMILPTGSGSVRAVLNRVTAENNTHGIVADGIGSTGSIVVQMNDSLVAGSNGNGIWSKKAGVVVNRTSSENNAGYGILSDGAASLIVLGNSSVIGNGGGLGAAGGGSIQSYQNNQTKGNGFDGAPTAVLSLN